MAQNSKISALDRKRPVFSLQNALQVTTEFVVKLKKKKKKKKNKQKTIASETITALGII